MKNIDWVYITFVLYINMNIYRFIVRIMIPYFSGCGIMFFFFSSFSPLWNSPGNLNLSYKLDLDHRDCSGGAKFVLQQKFIRRVWLFEATFGCGKPPSYSRIDTVT